MERLELRCLVSLACLVAGCSDLASGSDAGSGGNNGVTINVTMTVGVWQCPGGGGNTCPCGTVPGPQGCVPAPADAGACMEASAPPPCTPYRYCPVASPDPASVKVGQNFRWANVAGDAGPYTMTVLEGTTPLQTIAAGQVGDWLNASSPGTQTYSFATLPSVPLGCSPSGLQQPGGTLYVTTN
jgi:hypothetical protein